MQLGKMASHATTKIRPAPETTTTQKTIIENHKDEKQST